MNEINIQIQTNPNPIELKDLFERSFREVLEDETGYFIGDLNQDSLDDWLDFDALITYLPNGKLVEARDNDNLLIGAGFIAKQHPISWFDGHKAELFIIGVMPGKQHTGLGSLILCKCEEAIKEIGAKSIIVNSHSMQPQLHKFYKKNGYKTIGELTDYYDNGNAMFFKKDL